MGHLVEAIDADDAAAPGFGQAMLANLTDGLVGMDDVFSGVYPKVLRRAAKFDQHNIAGLQVADAGQAGLVIKGGLKQAIAGQAGIAGVVDVLYCQRFCNLNDQPGAIERHARQATLMHKRGIEAGARSGDDRGGGQWVPNWPYCEPVGM